MYHKQLPKLIISNLDVQAVFPIGLAISTPHPKKGKRISRI